MAIYSIKRKIIPFLLYCIVGCKKDIPVINLEERARILKDYTENYLGSSVLNPGWSGNVNNCLSGSINQNTSNLILKRINYFRKLVGLNDNTTLDASKSSMFQDAALIMSENSSLSHTPPNTWKCWSQSGYNGAKTSNLALGAHASNAVTLFINDPGANNIDVGHRRWILHSTKSKFSIGSTNNAMSLGVIGIEENNRNFPEFIAYPPKGYIPKPLVFGRWSFAIPGANFSNSTVTMTGPSGQVPLKIVSTKTGYGDNTIVWEPQNITYPSGSEDIIYRITIDNILNATKKTISYNVIIINP